MMLELVVWFRVRALAWHIRGLRFDPSSTDAQVDLLVCIGMPGMVMHNCKFRVSEDYIVSPRPTRATQGDHIFFTFIMILCGFHIMYSDPTYFPVPSHPLSAHVTHPKTKPKFKKKPNEINKTETERERKKKQTKIKQREESRVETAVCSLES